LIFPVNTTLGTPHYSDPVPVLLALGRVLLAATGSQINSTEREKEKQTGYCRKNQGGAHPSCYSVECGNGISCCAVDVLCASCGALAGTKLSSMRIALTADEDPQK